MTTNSISSNNKAWNMYRNHEYMTFVVDPEGLVVVARYHNTQTREEWGIDEAAGRQFTCVWTTYQAQGYAL